jgi:HAD superfamily hydrolase (TIGR01549 family)
MMNEFFLAGTEAVLFDMEGTLVDFQWDLEGAVRETLEMLEGSGFPVERLREKEYSSLMIEAMKMAPAIGRSPDRVREEIGAVYDRYDEDAFSRWSLRPGAEDFLEALKKVRVKAGLVSNVGKKALEKGILKLQIQELFQAVVTRNDVRLPKPSGEGIVLALGRLQVKSRHAFYVGDSPDDIRAAREAGVKVVLIAGGKYPGKELLSPEPDFLIEDFAELMSCLRRVIS